MIENFQGEHHSLHPPLRLGGSWNFGFLGEVKIFLISFSIHFLILKCKISKIQKYFACGALILNIHFFRFKTDAGLQVDIDFNTESIFFFQGDFSFHPSGDTKNQLNPSNCFLFYPFGGFRGPPKPSSQ